MANRYWVGGTGTWDASATHWSTSSGGSAGASVPTSSDSVIFDVNSNTGTGNFTVTLSGTRNCLDFTASGLDGGMTLAGNDSSILNIYGNFSIPATNFTSGTATNSTLSFVATSTGKTITTNGISLTFAITFAGVGGGWSLSGNLTTSRAMTLSNGTFNANNFNISALSFNASGSSTRTLTLGSGTHTFSSTGTAWTTNITTNLTFNKDTANIVLSGAAATFAGGGLTFNKVTIGAGATFTGANTFSELASTGTGNYTITLPNVTTTVGTWSINGSATSTVTLQRTGASGSFTLTKSSSGILKDYDYFSISNGNATPANVWYMGLTSTNGGGNTGFIFTRQPRTGNFFSFIYR